MTSLLEQFSLIIKEGSLNYSPIYSPKHNVEIKQRRKWFAIETKLATEDIMMLDKPFDYCQQCQVFILEIPTRKIKKRTKSVLGEEKIEYYCPICETYVFSTDSKQD